MQILQFPMATDHWLVELTGISPSGPVTLLSLASAAAITVDDRSRTKYFKYIKFVIFENTCHIIFHFQISQANNTALDD